MLFVLISTYLGVWACAHAAARSWSGRLGFWAFYAIATAIVPLVSGVGLGSLFRLLSPDYGATITPFAVVIGTLLAMISYPIKYLRSKVEE